MLIREFHRLFKSEINGFLGKLNLDDKDKSVLDEARKAIRDTLKTGLRAFAKSQDVTLEPRFMSQGSAVYKTQNSPNFLPPQQVDHDLGCYLPFSFLSESGSPSIAAAAFFAEVDRLLELLVKEKKWKKVVTSKATCSRVIINDRLHVDVPLYSVPDDQMHTILAFAKRSGFDSETFDLGEAYYDSNTAWPVVASDQVLLAHRKEGWKKSDPRKLNTHYVSVLRANEDLRRACRYMKAFRDQAWKEGGPSSIYLMALTELAFKSLPSGLDSDAEILLHVLSMAPSILIGDIRNPTDSQEIIGISKDDRTALSNACYHFGKDLQRAMSDSNISDRDACALISNHLGRRFPIQETVPPKEVTRIQILTKSPTTSERKPAASHTSG
jgi:hypothetical protein